MSTINASLSYLFASDDYAANRQAAQLGTLSATARDLKSALGNLRAGTTVSARTDYVVGSNGQLQPRSTSIQVDGQDVDQGGTPQQRPNYFNWQDRPGSLSDLQRPRASLNPADELDLFASQLVGDEGASPRRMTIDDAEDENGNAVEVELIAPEADTAATASASTSRQLAASRLYARNYGLAAVVEPELAFAA